MSDLSDLSGAVKRYMVRREKVLDKNELLEMKRLFNTRMENN